MTTLLDVEYVPLTYAAEDAGISYRQADTWVHAGHIHVAACVTGRQWPTTDLHQPDGCGPGHRRLLTPQEAEILDAMARLVRVGLAVPVAARAARAAAISGDTYVELGEGVAVMVP